MIENKRVNVDCVVLTYDNVLHRKTYDTLCLLKASGYQNVIVWAVPMHYKKSFHPLYEHRPPINNDILTSELCENFQYQYIISENGYEKIEVDKDVPLLVCGAGIIPEHVIKKYRVINAHPGYIPFARGLDAFKWAIYKGLPIGVTTHFLGEEVDAGEVIERREIPIYQNDTFHLLAQRVYNNEIQMLVGALKKINEKHIYISAGDNILFNRMGLKEEEKLMDCFQKLLLSKSRKRADTQLLLSQEN